MAERNKPHLIIHTPPRTEPFTGISSGGGAQSTPFGGDRAAHGRRLSHELDAALTPLKEEEVGTYITFVSFAGLELTLESLEPQGSGDQPELVAVSDDQTNSGRVQMATVYIPDGKKQYFLTRLAKYVETVAADKTKHAALIEGIESIRRATIRELWTDAPRLFPPSNGDRHWWEVWLRRRDGDELTRLLNQTDQRHIPTSAHYLGFGDRTVLLLQATNDELSQIFESLDDLAELRWPHDVASVLTEMPASEQADWAADLCDRLVVADNAAPAVCVVDTGIQDGHPLLKDSLDLSDIHVAESIWKSEPSIGHGTEMAGLALFGDLHEAVLSPNMVRLRHRLESVKFLPDNGSTVRDLYGAVTARSVDRPEIQAPTRNRAFMLAVTAPRQESDATGEHMDPYEAGKPTSWSATIDALAYGRSIDDTDPKFTYLDRNELSRSRLFIISAGNIRDIVPTDEHLDRSDLEPVEDPSQAWNALTVGAYTDRDEMAGADSIFAGYTPLAPRGELAPVSRTSVVFDDSKWPFKPDVVAEGGNVAVSTESSDAQTPESLAVLTTRLQGFGQRAFTTTRDTSAATAQVAAIAGQIMAEYPDLRAETVRALIVHSAQWTPAMTQQIDAAPTKAEKAKRLRRYGMGVPNLPRALHSATDSLTLIAESRIRPFERENNATDGKSREMNLHALPWPRTELEALGDTDVLLRVTLSYFVEPNPSNRGWTGRYLYPSHGLRFAVRRPDDSLEAFRVRINSRAREGGEKPLKLATEKGWLFGSNQQQSAGSLHTDIWKGPAVNLASKEAIAVYPVAGWWKNRRDYDQSQLGVSYSLVVSIESPEIDVDLWTPVAQQISSEVSIET